MDGIIPFLLGEGAVNDHDAAMLVTQGFGNWGGSEYVVTEGFGTMHFAARWWSLDGPSRKPVVLVGPQLGPYTLEGGPNKDIALVR